MALKLNIGRISSDPQTTRVSVSQAGAIGSATASFGRSVAQAGGQIGNLVERRRDEEARGIVSRNRTEDKLLSTQERREFQEKYADDPLGMSDDLEKTQQKRHNKILKNVTNEKAKEKLQRDFELTRLENKIESITYERTQFTKNSVKNIISGAELKAQATYEQPVGVRELKLDMEEDLLDIQNRDLSQDIKDDLMDKVIDTRVKGAVAGYMKGGSALDFRRAEELVDSIDKLPPEKKQRMKSSIDNERRRVQNLRLHDERVQRKALEKKFIQEQGVLRDVFQVVSDDPEADISDDLKIFQSQGKIPSKNFRVLSEAKMTEGQVAESSMLRNSALEALTDSDNPLEVRNMLYNEVLSGKMSTEDASMVLDSIQVRTDKKFKKDEYRFADNLLKNSIKSSFGFQKQSERVEINQMIKERDDIVRDLGVDPTTARVFCRRLTTRS